MAEYVVTVQRTVFEELTFDVEANSVEEATRVAAGRYKNGYEGDYKEVYKIRDDPDWSSADVWTEDE